MELLRGWIELSELERRAFAALTQELCVSSELVERSTLELSERFQELAEIAQAQMGRVDEVITVASSLTVDGETISLDEALQSVEITLGKAIETVLFISKHAMRLVYTLEDVARDVSIVERCSTEIEVINQQARYLALNAAIEAARSGASGGAFGVIAHEMKELSQATGLTAIRVRGQVDAVSRGVQRGHVVLQEIATLDLTESIMAKERIDKLIAAISAQHQAFNMLLGDAAESSGKLTSTIGELVTGMQFQDRTKQHIAQVIDTLGALEQSAAAQQQASCAAYPTLVVPTQIDSSQLARILERQTLGGMKARVLERLLARAEDGQAANEPAEADDTGGDVELF